MIQRLWTQLINHSPTLATPATYIPELHSATPKVFCVGMNKTGTTSLDAALTQRGYRVAPQAPAELLIHDWAKRDFTVLVEFCHTADAFQDIPFSLPYTSQALDMHFPQSKFIVTIRASSDEWYRSICSFHGKLWNNGQVPQMHHLKAANYRYPRYTYEYEACKYIFNTTNNNLYNQSTLIQCYERHNAAIQGYFRYRPDDLLVINVSHPNAYHQLCDFWANRASTPLSHRRTKRNLILHKGPQLCRHSPTFLPMSMPTATNPSIDSLSTSAAPASVPTALASVKQPNG